MINKIEKRKLIKYIYKFTAKAHSEAYLHGAEPAKPTIYGCGLGPFGTDSENMFCTQLWYLLAIYE